MINSSFPKSDSRIRSKSLARAFTLIELLVVISIIGMLSSVIMVSLQGARDKGRIGAGIKFATYNNRACGADAIAFYNFNETGTTALDQSGNGITLTLNNGATLAGTDKVSASGGNYLNLDGTNDYAVSSSGAIPSKTIQKFTTSAWVKADTLPSVPTVYQTIVGLYGSSGHTASLIIGQDGLIYGQLSSCVGQNNVKIKTGVWQHIAVTNDGTKFSFYIDGKLINSLGTGCSSVTVNNSFVFVGAYPGGAPPTAPSYYFDGSIDDAAIYTQSLTASEVQKLYALGAAEHGIALK